jgi:hypothetical protein
MAVGIDDLQVQTQPTQAPPSAPAKPAASAPRQDVQAELEKIRERELRLKVD